MDLACAPDMRGDATSKLAARHAAQTRAAKPAPPAEPTATEDYDDDDYDYEPAGAWLTDAWLATSPLAEYPGELTAIEQQAAASLRAGVSIGDAALADSDVLVQRTLKLMNHMADLEPSFSKPATAADAAPPSAPVSGEGAAATAAVGDEGAAEKKEDQPEAATEVAAVPPTEQRCIACRRRRCRCSCWPSEQYHTHRPPRRARLPRAAGRSSAASP